MTRKSTATLFVEGFKSVLYPARRGSDHPLHRTCIPHDMGEGGEGEAGGPGEGADEIPSSAAARLASPSQLPLADSEVCLPSVRACAQRVAASYVASVLFSQGARGEGEGTGQGDRGGRACGTRGMFRRSV